MSNGNIFISYRREDTSGHAGRIYDRLNNHFPGRVFRDVAGIDLGEDFVAAIERHVGACEVFIELVGDRWATITDHTGKRRLDDPDDFVRLELATALRRGVTVIPILVNGATMPAVSSLPADIAALTRRNALQITETDFDHDVERLIKRLETIFGKTGTTGNRYRLARQIGLGVVALLVIGAIGFVLWNVFKDRGNTTNTNRTADVNPQPTASANINKSPDPTPGPTATSQIIDELRTPPKDSSERRAITDVLREEFSSPQSIHYVADRGRIVFLLHTLKVHNGWAWTLVEPRSEKNPGASFRETSPFLLHQLNGGRWVIMNLPPSVDDDPDTEYPTTRDIENIRKMYPSMPADILQK
jgi:hypothetical protein